MELKIAALVFVVGVGPLVGAAVVGAVATGVVVGAAGVKIVVEVGGGGDEIDGGLEQITLAPVGTHGTVAGQQ